MKERNGGDKSVLLHGFSHFLWEKKKKSLSSEPQHKHHKLVIASEFTCIQLEFLNITKSSK